ncbi:hypothetical protein DFS33DRAFT_387460 [Desarmillaria ectypa]|nr:hypothetical protein DFS33DRAFT_387460 [Desarmillaria ectypa]
MDSGSVRRSREFWLEEGDVVLKAESTIFRITRGILVYHSPVLLQMILQGNPDPTSETVISGCRVIKVDDSAVDWYHFLKAIHDPSYYDPARETPFAAIAGILRLSTKYQAQTLQTTVVEHLQRIFPTTIDEWDRRADNDTIQKFRGRTIAIINLAQETNHQILLPSAMAYSWAIGLDGLLDGLPSYDGSHVELDWDTKRKCIRARDKLVQAVRGRLLKFILGRGAGRCATKPRCDEGRLLSLNIWEKFFSESVIPTPFRFMVNWTDLSTRLCEHCIADGRNSFLTARWLLWDELPSYFDLPSWEVLRRREEDD